jgi:hypothetical protein
MANLLNILVSLAAKGKMRGRGSQERRVGAKNNLLQMLPNPTCRARFPPCHALPPVPPLHLLKRDIDAIRLGADLTLDLDAANSIDLHYDRRLGAQVCAHALNLTWTSRF